ncbi:hypothetical protein NDU88_006782 [Pleurodeles waltl]|uniref:Uncharacterized protein n=1 Tax=Pleurodeles waltl TaxID=8319 RepID=A0AAV7RT18_PLEWA|nr:hypothetical protein NDU88_006782 [Pleurodeles waltl]
MLLRLPVIHGYWESVVPCLNTVCDNAAVLSTKWCLLNIWDKTDLTTIDQVWMTLGLIEAKRNIARTCKAGRPLELEDWKLDLDWRMLVERVVYTSLASVAHNVDSEMQIHTILVDEKRTVAFPRLALYKYQYIVD